MRASYKSIIFWISFILLISASYLWRMQSSFWHLNSFGYDEGIHLILGKLWSAGYTPYEQIFVSYPPIFFWSLGVPWELFSQVSALRLLLTTYALFGVVAVVYLGTVYHSRLAGIAAGIFLSFAPAYFIASMQVMGEVPSIGMATVAIALAEKYRRGGGWIWVLLVGGTLAFSLSLKILPFYAGPFVMLVILSRHIFPGSQTGFLKGLKRSKWLIVRDLALLTGGFLVVFLVPLLFLNPTALYEQVVAMRLSSREAQTNPFDSNNKDIVEFLFGNPGLMALALYGLIFVVGQNLKEYWLLLVWFIFVWVSMHFHVPLRGKHLPIFLPLLAIFAGFAVSHIFNLLRHIKHRQPSLGFAAMVLAILIVTGMFGWNTPKVIAENSGKNHSIDENKERETAIDFINKISTPTDCVIADNPVFLFNTQRLPPPELSETSQTRIDTGYLTLQDVINSIQTYNCHVVAVVTPRFGESIPNLPEWLANNYLGLHAQDETFVYFGKKGADNNFTSVPNGDFENVAQLYGFHLSNELWKQGRPDFISLYWQTTSLLQTKYVEKITLRNVTDQEIFHQIQRFPLEGYFTPGDWPPGEQVRDTFRLDIPADLPAGSYGLYISLCLPDTDECLSINHQTQTELYLSRLTIQP